MIAKTFHGLEEVLASELRELGATEVRVQKRAVFFLGDKRTLYRANYELRTALRILLPIAVFRARNEDELYKNIYRIDWARYMTLRHSFAIDAVVHSTIFRHSHYCALKTKDAIADRFRDQIGERPYVNTNAPAILINLHINEDEVTISLDSSGEPLFKRGYRVQSVEAPINEVLAAGMLMLSGWYQTNADLLDPFCGSGTILAEGAMLSCNTPPQILRTEFGFQKWLDYDADLWSEVVKSAKANTRPLQHHIFGSDIDFKAVRIAQNNLELLGLHDDHVPIVRKAFEKLELPTAGRCFLVTNPPYDERLKNDDIQMFYTNIGKKIKSDFKGSSIWLVSSNKEAMSSLGMKPSKKHKLFNGALECSFNAYEVFEQAKVE